MIDRTALLSNINATIRRSPITAILGPRQCGKTTIAREIASSRASHYFDLEDVEHERRLRQAKLNLSPLRGLVILDEIQRRPDLFPLLRVLADRRPMPCRFLILGSASPDLMKHSSESLAGRVQFIDMTGFTLNEVGMKHRNALWLRGGFPKSFLAKNEKDSRAWRESFIRTFLQRDIPQLGLGIAPETLRRFWTMVAHFHGQIWNASDIGRSLGFSHHTVNGYLDALTGTFVVRRLHPWHENLGKRIVRSPKIYIRDSGILHTLFRISGREELFSHPKLGASWEGFALEQVLSIVGEQDAYFYATHGGAELDLVLLRGGKKWGIEFKFRDAPSMTKSLHTALNDLSPKRICVLYPGDDAYPIHEKIDCVSIDRFHAWAKKMKLDR